jgi:hypothetical protein
MSFLLRRQSSARPGLYPIKVGKEETLAEVQILLVQSELDNEFSGEEWEAELLL